MTVQPSARDIRSALHFWAGQTPDATAIAFMAKGEQITASFTFRELFSRTSALAHDLAQRVPKGQTALLVYPPDLSVVEAILACFLAGIIAIPLPLPMTPSARQRIISVLAATQAQTILTTSAAANDAALRAAIPAACIWHETDQLGLTPPVGMPALPEGQADDLAFIQFTSGSTSTPRGVAISFANLVANHAMIGTVYSTNPSEPMATWLPAFHDMGLIGSILFPLQAGRAVYMMPPNAFLQKPVRWLRAISASGATESGAPSFAYDLCARMVTPKDLEGLDLSRWRTAFCGAEPIRTAALQRFAAKFTPAGFSEHAFLPTYGLAEATLFVAGGPTFSGVRLIDKKGRKIAASGKVSGSQRLCITGPDHLPLPEGETGEIWISGPHVSRGYWRNKAASDETFGLRLANETEGAFLRTGDLGFVQDGYLFVTGRIKDILIVRGIKHHLNDLDTTICAVSEVLVPGAGTVFTETDDLSGTEHLVAVHEISRRAYPLPDDAALAAAVAEAVLRGHGIRLDHISFVREGRLPRTTSGKVQRQNAQAYASRTMAADD